MKFFKLLPLVLFASFAWAGEGFKIIHTPELAQLMRERSLNLAIFDVNQAEVRKKDGIIPGAKLLSSSSRFSVAKELPAEKDAKLVFYCANTKCTASHTAAKRAVKSGYTDVAVLSDGIQGWAKAGQEVTKGQFDREPAQP